jgi:putative SOS response-associated peptidase YedK
MCALYTLRTSYAELLDSFPLSLSGTERFEAIDERFLPHKPAPVIKAVDNKFSLEWMNFSLIPSWSKERRPKFATHNARLESLGEKPTWGYGNDSIKKPQ